jgi:hypothetical protein
MSPARQKPGGARRSIFEFGGYCVTKKTKVSNGDLTALFYERMRDAPGFPQQDISIAIVPSEPHGWTALISARQRKQKPRLGERSRENTKAVESNL